MKLARVIMGMPITIEVVGGKERRVKEAIEAAFGRLDWYDHSFSTYKPDSEISRINRGELKWTEADTVVQQVLAECDKMRGWTGGYFDMRRPGGGIDPSGLVKGWAIARAAETLESHGSGNNYCVEAGGDIVTSGHNQQGQPWAVGIRNPLKPDEIVKILRLKDGAVATSGTYERGEHIYDPHTGRPANSLASVTVVGPEIVQADIAATAGFAMGGSAAVWLALQPGLEAYVIDHDGTATFTDGLARYLD